MNDQIIDGEVVEKKAKADDPKTVSGSLTDDVKAFEDPALGGFWSNLKRVLTEAEISMRQFYLLLGCFGIFVIALIVFLYFLIQIIFTDSASKISVRDREFQEDRLDAPIPRERTNFNSSLSAGIMIGAEASQTAETFARSLEAGIELGMEGAGFDISNEILQSINTLKKLDTVLEVNVNSLLELSDDREKTLESYLTQSKQIFAEAAAAATRLNSIMSDFKDRFEIVSSDKQLYEDAYFANIDLLYGIEAEEALKKFIELGRQQNEIKAQFEARKKLKSLLDPRISKLELRIKAIELNKEALIKGITIVPVEGSGIDLIQN